MLLGLGAEAQLVDVVDDLAEVVAAGDLVFQLTEDLADLVFDGVRAGGAGFEFPEVGKEAVVDEVAQVVAGHGAVVVEGAVGFLRRGPRVPAVFGVEDVGVFLAAEFGFGGAVLLQAVEVFEEDEPGGLLGVVEFGGATGFFAEGVANVAEGLFKHGAGWMRMLERKVFPDS